MFKKVDDYVGQISLGNLIDGIGSYLKRIIFIYSNIFSFPNSLHESTDIEFSKSINFIIYSIVLSFFLLIPVYAVHHESITKVLFLIRFLTNYCIWGLLIHIGLKLFGARSTTLKQTGTVYAYIMGIGLPTYLLIFLPILIKLGPMGVFGDIDNIHVISTNMHANTWLTIYYTISFAIFSIFSWVIMLTWFSKTHGISKIRVFFAILLAGMIGSISQIHIVNKIFNAAFKKIDYWIGLIF